MISGGPLLKSKSLKITFSPCIRSESKLSVIGTMGHILHKARKLFYF